MVRTLLFLVLLSLANFPLPTYAQEPIENESRAIRLLRRSLDALGGLERLRALKTIYLAGKGVENLTANVQGLHPENETIRTHEESMAVQIQGSDVAYERRTPRNDMSIRWRRTLFRGDERIFADWVSLGYSSRSLPSDQLERDGLRRRIPHVLLLEAAQRSQDLGWGGQKTLDGRAHEVVTLSVAVGEPLNLFIDSSTGFLSRVAYRMHVPGLGDTSVEFDYLDYRAHEQLGWFPTEQVIRIGGKVFQQIRINRVETDSPEGEALLSLPDEFRSPQPGVPQEIAEGVFYVPSLGGFNLFFVEFDEFVLAVEAPADSPWMQGIPAANYSLERDVSREYIQKIKETIPEKPIRYVVVTHSHSDHAGGSRRFMAEGTTILTTPGNRGFFERMAAAQHTIKPDPYSQISIPLKLEQIETKRAISDGRRTVEIMNVGPNPHTDEMLIVYLPEEKILFQGDLFYYVKGRSFPLLGRTGITRFFAKWLAERNIWPDRIYGFHGLGFATSEHVRHMNFP